ncbi:hypothetical protein CC78DRAFT_498673, partial [Lojkania enalia]
MASPFPHDMNSLIDLDMQETIPQPVLNDILSKEPFKAIPGIINIRDIGFNASPSLRRGLIYRAGALHSIPASSAEILKNELGIKLIIDLRSEREVVRFPDPEIEGVKYVYLTSTRVPSPIDLNDFVSKGGEDGYVKIYKEILEIHQPSIRAALAWIRDEETPLLFHCTAGKDRTGVLAAVILGLVGSPKEAIAHDYALTRVGIEPAKELLLVMLKAWNKEWSMETPGMAEFSQIKASFMLRTLQMVADVYGGMEGYVKGVLGFSDEDIVNIRGKLR